MYIIYIIQVLKHASMRCGGCGAKVGATVLSNVMRRLREEVPMADATKNQVLVGLDAPDDCAVVAPGVFFFSYISTAKPTFLLPFPLTAEWVTPPWTFHWKKEIV